MPPTILLMEKIMEVLSEVNVGDVTKPIKKLFENSDSKYLLKSSTSAEG